ncbi:hypothetical protein [Desulfopila sp. IMCC35008]|uniref:hypothetical protein n=1 Tax=Desulfopila sp. IMCC35008 TaxID=2653858 RepID=UPI002714E30A|nr:hypothetical protein [Desulfopila sp. IMCC35008]
MIGKSRNTPESIIGIKQLPTFRTVLVPVVITLGDIILLLSNDPAICTIIGRYGGFSEEDLWGKRKCKKG